MLVEGTLVLTRDSPEESEVDVGHGRYPRGSGTGSEIATAVGSGSLTGSGV
jgi:hypothetical protein